MPDKPSGNHRIQANRQDTGNTKRQTAKSPLDRYHFRTRFCHSVQNSVLYTIQRANVTRPVQTARRTYLIFRRYPLSHQNKHDIDNSCVFMAYTPAQTPGSQAENQPKDHIGRKQCPMPQRPYAILYLSAQTRHCRKSRLSHHTNLYADRTRPEHKNSLLYMVPTQQNVHQRIYLFRNPSHYTPYHHANSQLETICP